MPTRPKRPAAPKPAPKPGPECPPAAPTLEELLGTADRAQQVSRVQGLLRQAVQHARERLTWVVVRYNPTSRQGELMVSPDSSFGDAYAALDHARTELAKQQARQELATESRDAALAEPATSV